MKKIMLIGVIFIIFAVVLLVNTTKNLVNKAKTEYYKPDTTIICRNGKCDTTIKIIK